MKYILQLVLLSGLFACGDKNEIKKSKEVDPLLLTYFNVDWSKDFTNISYPAHYDVNVLNMDNTPANNSETNEGIILGRILFHDKKLSINNSVSCASCHQQDKGFTDATKLSLGFEGGETGAHSMRIGNARFYQGLEMFWDRRATSLEDQSTQPIKNEVEMGFDDLHGGFSAVVDKLENVEYYPILFEYAFGDSEITEERVQMALAQFMRNIVSLDSRFDDGFELVFNQGPAAITNDFSTFTESENLGKRLFFLPPNQGGVGCAGCHKAPTMSLDANSLSNGLDEGETTIFKAPSLKNIAVTGPYMHDGRFATLEEVIEHYNSGVKDGPALDNRLKTGNGVLTLNLTEQEKTALVDFLKTLTDQTMLTNVDYSDPLIED